MKKLLVLLFLSPLFCFGQENVKPLFASDEILNLRIQTNVRETISDREERAEHEGKIFYTDKTGTEVELDIKLVVRGNTRANPSLCNFPPLKVNFKKKQVKGTIFEGQNKLKLVAHCNSRPINEQYVFREYYVYKLYQLVTPFSFQVRLCKIVYDDTEGKFNADEHYGFLIEDLDDLALRNGMEEYEGRIFNQDACYKEELDKLTMFQFMVGNLDWSVPNGHNFKVIYGDQKPYPIAVPYDFDFSGMVNTTYAKPPPEIDVSNVTIRVFRGYCRPVDGYNVTIEHFISLKSQFYDIYQKSPYLSEKSKKMSIDYLDSFYKILDNPKSVNKKITRVCRVSHKHLFEQ